jgi:predicted alpha/beta hydrolase family esterase
LVGTTGPRIVVVPRWGGGPNDDWYPWLVSELAGITVDVLNMPSPDAPTIDAWTSAVVEALGDDPYTLARTLLIGHSVGCQAAVRAVAALPPGRSVAHLLGVAGWLWVDTPWDAIVPWLQTPIDPLAVADGAQAIRVLLSTDDPFTADHAANATAWRERFEAEVHLVPDAGHFNAAEQPIVLQHVRELFMQL